MKNLTPPKWAPYAVATERGWVNPKTGELLISLKGLKSKIEAENPTVVLDLETTKECFVDTTFVEIETEERHTTIEIIIEPSPEGSMATVEPISEETKLVVEKRGRGRPRKNSIGS